MRRDHLLPLAVWTALWAAFFGAVLLGPARLPDGDFSNQFHAFGLHQAREMAAGRLPLWSAGSYSGFPFAADTQSAVFYPPRWLTILLSLPWGFTYYALELEALLHVWLAGVLTYFLAHDMTGRREAGLLAAAAFGLGGYLVSYPIQQLAILETIAWLPLVLLLIRRATRGRAVAHLLAAALVFALAIVAGHPQTALHAGYLAAAYYLFQSRRAGWSWRRTLGHGMLVAVVALGASAGAWLPALRYAAETTRTDVGYDFVSSGFPLIDYAQTFVPGTLTLWSPQTIGLAGVLLALLAWRGRGRLDDYPQPGERLSRAEIGFWSVAALVALWLSLGDAGVLFEGVYRLVPGFSLFRQQERLAGVFSLSLALSAAQGLALWMRESGRDFSGPIRAATAIVAAALLGVGLLLFAAPATGWAAAFGRQWALLALSAAVLFGLRARPRLGTGLVVALLALDLFVAVRPTMGLVAGSPVAFWPRPAWINALSADAPGRIDSQSLVPANLGEIYALEDIRGISPLKSAAVERYESLPRRLRWQLLNVTHVLAPEPLEPGLEPLVAADESIVPGQALNATLYRFVDARPRAWFATEALVAADNAAALTILQQPGFDPARQVVLGPDAAAALPLLDSTATVSQITKLPRGLTIRYDAAAPGLLVISEWQRPGWRLTLEDGQPLTPMSANAGLMAVVVPAGTHSLRADYTAPDVWLGLIIAAAMLVVVGLILWRERGRVESPHAAQAQPRRAAVALPAPTETAASAIPTSKTARLAWVVALLLAGFALRVFLLGNQELRGDEAFNYLFARLPVAEVMPELLRQGDPHPPLHYLALSAWTKLAGESEFALRYLSLVAGVLLLPVVYVLGRRLGGRRFVSMLAAALAAVSPSLIWLSQDARGQYQWMPFFAALATLFLVAAVDERGRGRFWLAYALAAAATMYTHYYGIFPLLAHGLYVALSPGWRRNLPRWIAAGVAAAALLAPWLLVSAGRVFGAGHVGAPGQPELARHLVAIGRELVVGQTLPGRLGRWLAVGGVALALVGGAALLRDPRRRPFVAMLLGWVVAAAFGTFLIRFTREVFNPYYLVVAAPAWWLLVAVGIDTLRPRTGWRRAALAIGLGVWGFALLLSLNNYYFDPAHSRSLGYRDVADRLAAAAAPGDLFINHFPDPVWDYYLRDVAIERSLQPATLGAAASETEAALSDLVASHDRLWIVPYRGSVWDPDGVVTGWLEANALREADTIHNRQELLAYRPLRVVSEFITPAGGTLDGRIRLLGSAVTVNGLPVSPAQPVSLSPGDALAVTLVWEALQPVPASLTVFVHLADATGPLLGQHDGAPVDGRRPTDSWQPGEIILDRHELTVAADAAGSARLIAGMYDPVTVERLTYDDGTDAALLLDVIVGP